MKVLLLSQYDESQATTRIRLISLQKKLRKFGFKPSSGAGFHGGSDLG